MPDERAASRAHGRSRDGRERVRGRTSRVPGRGDRVARASSSRITSATRLLDLAAGTGRLDAAALRAHARDRRGRARPRDARGAAALAARRSRCSTAPPSEIPLPDASVDAVVVAQAFHWFDADRRARRDLARARAGRQARTRLAQPRPLRPAAARVPRDRRAATGRARRSTLGRVAPITTSRAGAPLTRDRRDGDPRRARVRRRQAGRPRALDEPLRARSTRPARPQAKRRSERSCAASGSVELPYAVELGAFRQAATTSH